MAAPEFSIYEFAKDVIVWLSAPVFLLIAWAWNRNQKEHDDLWTAHDTYKKDASVRHSTMNDRLMEYIDSTLSEVKDEQRRKSDRLNDNITKLFENAEADRKEFSKLMAEHREDSYKRHIELLHAINNKVDKT